MKEILELTKDTCTPDIEHGTTCSDMGTYNGDDIMNGLNLVHHSETLSSDDQIMRTLGKKTNPLSINRLLLIQFFLKYILILF